MKVNDSKLMHNCVKGLIPIIEEIINLQSIERILHKIVEQLVKQLDCLTCAIVQIHPETELLEILNFHNLSWNFCKDYRKKIVSPIIRELIWKGTPINIPNRKYASTFADELKMEKDFTSCFAVQLAAHQKPLGFLYVDSAEVDHFKEDQQSLVDLYSKIISICIFQDRLTAKLKRLESEDPDSGAVRYEQFYPRLQEVFQRSNRLNENLSLILFDIEHYGAIIKMYGLEVASNLLQEFVALLKSNLRPYDVISRFGADEFLIVLPGTTNKEAVQVAKKINSLLENAEFTNQKLHLASFAGVANFPMNCKSLNGLVTATKNALLEAKRHKDGIRILSSTEIFE